MNYLRAMTLRDWIEFPILLGMVVGLPLYGETQGIPIWVSFPAMFGLAHLIPWRKVTS